MKNKTLFILGWFGLVGFLLWIFFRSKTQTGQEVTGKISAYFPTQLGAPASAIAALSYEQLQNDVAYWIDPASGDLIANQNDILDGRVPLVALSDANQISSWFQQNAKAALDMDMGG